MRLRAISLLFFSLLIATLSLCETKRSAFIVKAVIDGDTIGIDDNGRFQPVRFIGIDTPESRVNEKMLRDSERTKSSIKTITKLGQKAADHLRDKVKKGDTVFIEFDTEKSDRYGKRWYAYVYDKNGNFLNEAMVREGFALTMTVPPNTKHQKTFSIALEEARKHERGLWKEGLK